MFARSGRLNRPSIHRPTVCGRENIRFRPKLCTYILKDFRFRKSHSNFCAYQNFDIFLKVYYGSLRPNSDHGRGLERLQAATVIGFE